MTLAYFCILIAVFLPLFCAAYAKQAAGFRFAEHNSRPRDFLAHAEGRAARAHAAQQNGYEVFAPFAAAVLVAHATGGAAQGVINFWALLFVASRLFYIYCYISDKHTWRSLAFTLGLVCIAALFVAAF